MAVVAVTLITLIEAVNESIRLWVTTPLDMVKGMADSTLGLGLTDGHEGGKTRDLLIIRLHCAEEFQRVATEYADLLEARLGVDD